jgi:hypothetical protein
VSWRQRLKGNPRLAKIFFERFGDSAVFGESTVSRHTPGSELTDANLRSLRDQSHWAIDQVWDRSGWKITNIDCLEDVPGAFRACRRYGDVYVCRLLSMRLNRNAIETARAQLGADTRLATIKLAKIREQLSTANSRIISTAEEVRRCSELLKRSKYEALSGQRDFLRTARRTCVPLAIRLRTLKGEYRNAISQRKEVDSLLNTCSAYFCQQQILAFCRSGRNKIKPLTLANACAGSPFMGFRTSRDRCATFPDSFDGPQYLIFERIEQAVTQHRHGLTNGRSTVGILKSVESWINGLPSFGYSESHLKANLPTLLRAIEHVERMGLKVVDEIPFAVFRFFTFLVKQRRPSLSNEVSDFLSRTSIVASKKRK